MLHVGSWVYEEREVVDMIIPDFVKLYEPYSEKATLEQTLSWLKIQSEKIGADENLMNKAVIDTFLEMAGGKYFPVDGGDTGFTNIPHAALNHYLLDKMVGYHDASMHAYRQATEGLIQARMVAHLEAENKKFTDDNMKTPWWKDWSKSPIAKMFKKKAA